MPRSKLAIVPREPSRRQEVPNNLPIQLTPLIGRDREVEDLLRVQNATEDEKPGVRLLTLTGPGGVGKTRLALQVAGEALEEFEDGVFVVELASIIDPDLVVPAIASVLQLREVPDTTLVSTLIEHLENKRILLVLDNFEQVITARGSVDELLAGCPNLKLLVTSRTALRLRAEREFAVTPLALPDPQLHTSAGKLVQYGAVALFVQRAGAVESDFALTNENAGAVLEICRKVDGLPLAIELVAAHSRLLSPQSIVARLTNPLRVLTGGSHDATGRHQTMRATIEWSYNLLTEEEQRLFRRLSVFSGGWSLWAAEAVCNEGAGIEVKADDPLAIEVLEGLERLVDKNLVRRLEQREGGDRRLEMLETVREYAWEQLEVKGEAEVLRQRHADYYLAVAERVGSIMKGAELTASLAKLATEEGNLRAVLQWLLERQGADGSDDALRLIQALQDFWQRHMHLSELRGWLDRALAQASPSATLLRALSLRWAAGLARWQGDFPKATALGEEALTMARELGDELEIANALDTLGGVALYQSDYETAGARSKEALIKYRGVGAEKNIMRALSNLGLVATYRGDYERAEELYRESLQLHREQGEKAGALTPLSNLGYAIYYQGDWRRAREIFVETLALTLEVDREKPAARALAGLAGAILAKVDLQPENASQDLPGVAQATQLLGLSEAQRQRGGGNFDPRSQAEFERNVATVRGRLGEAAFTAAWEEGQALTLEQAFELATRSHAEDASQEAQPRGRGRPKKRAASGLTDREFEVTALLAQGMTNPEIALQLVLSVRTVEAHVANVMQKLGLHTRTELTAWAVRGGIASESAQE